MSIQFWRRAVSVIAAIGIVALALAPPARADGSDGSVRDLASQAGVPGGAVAFLDEGSVERVETFGTDGFGQPVEPSTRMLWGSISKPVAAAVAMRLAKEGSLDLDALVSDYLEGGPQRPVRSLIDHTSGLPFGAANLDVARPHSTAVEAASGLDPAAGTPGAHQYSSLGYLYLQAVIESATGRPYADSLAAVSPGAGATAVDCADVATGHRFVGPFALNFTTTYDGAGAAYGYTCGSIEDLSTFVVSQFGGESATLDAQTTVLVETGTPGTHYGLGWRVTEEPDGRRTVWHTGTVPGYFSAIYLDPATGDGVVVLLNASGFLHDQTLAAITRAAYDDTTGREPAAVPTAWLASATPAALLLLAAVALVVMLRARSTRRRAVAIWAAATGVTAATALVVAPALLGFPLRYFWLWEPALVMGTLLLLATLLAGLAVSIVRWRR